MVTTLDSPVAVEFISEIAAEPDCAMIATWPGATLSVTVDGYRRSGSVRLMSPMQFGPWIAIELAVAKRRYSASSSTLNPLLNTTTDRTPASCNSPSTPVTPEAGMATTAASTPAGSAAMLATVSDPSMDAATGCTGM